MARSRGYDPLHTSPENTALLDRAIAHATGQGPEAVAVLDLDGCLFDTRPRQVRIFREYAEQHDAPALARVREEHFVDWSLGRTVTTAGLPEAWRQAHLGPLRAFWEARFFTSEYVTFDHAMPGSVAFVRALHAAGVHVVYLTGRDATMRAGTEVALRHFGFPYATARATLLTKPNAQLDDTEFKDRALDHVETLGRVVLYLDNEPANVNMYRRRHPDALVVFVETDHSPRPDEPDPAIPWLRSFVRQA